MSHDPSLLRPRLSSFLAEDSSPPAPTSFAKKYLIGVFEGTGIGPEVVGSALRVLSCVSELLDINFEIRLGGLIGEASESRFGHALSREAIDFCQSIFEGGGVVLSGPGGGRYVYDLRRQFDLFCKFVPVQPFRELLDIGCLHARHVEGVDMLIVRDNTGGVYQGQWSTRGGPMGRVARHSFHYGESQVRRLIEVAARAAAARRGQLHVVVKDSGVPAISELWNDVAGAVARRTGISCTTVNVDLAAYQIIQNPGLFDVIVTPNLIGDIIADLAGVLVGSRGVTFSGNYSADGRAVYQTNHGCAHDLAEKDVANPAGQILSLAMLLRESFGMENPASLMEQALANAWRHGHRTADVARPGDLSLGTSAMTEQVIAEIHQLANSVPLA